MVEQRIRASLTQQIFLLEKKDDLNYVVMGTTGKTYKVCINAKPTCTCPDFKIRRKRCKHIYFVLIRIMKVANFDEKNYSDNEISQMIKNIPILVDNLHKVIPIEKINIEPKIDDSCPICLEDVKNYPYDFCHKCGHCVHIECFHLWITFGNKENKCIFCNSYF